MSRKPGFSALLIAFLTLAFLSVLIFYLFFSGSEDNLESAGNIYTVTEKTIRPYISVSGEIFPDKYHELTFQTSGKVEEVFVNPGDNVMKGEPLAKIKSEEAEISLKMAVTNMKSAAQRLQHTKKMYDIQIKQTKSNLSQIMNELEKLRTQINSTEKKIKELMTQYSLYPQTQVLEEIEKLESSLISLKKQKEELEKSVKVLQNNIENLETNRANDTKLALYQFEQAKLSYEKEKKAFKNLTIYSPADGTVLFVGLKKGQLINTSSFFSPPSGTQQSDSNDLILSGKKAIVIAEKNWLPESEVVLDQMDIVKVTPGLKAEAYLDAIPEIVLSGRVETVNYFPVKNTTGSGSYVATILFTKKPEKLVAGMSAIIKIYLEEKKGLAVPVASLRYVNGIPCVYVISKGKAHQRKVKVQDSDDSYSIVTSGLKKGEKIIADISLFDVENFKTKTEENNPESQSSSRRRPFLRIFR